MANLVTFNETTYDFCFNITETFNYDGKGTNEVEYYDILINGKESMYYVQFDTKSDSYSLWSKTSEKRGGFTHRELTPFGINGKSGFPISVVCDIVKEINK